MPLTKVTKEMATELLAVAGTSDLKSLAVDTPVVMKDSAGTEVGQLCTAWVNFNGTGVVAIRDSFNVGSITDNGVGNYTINFTNAMANANYAATAGIIQAGTAAESGVFTTRSTTQLTVNTKYMYSTTITWWDPIDVGVTVHGGK